MGKGRLSCNQNYNQSISLYGDDFNYDSIQSISSLTNNANQFLDKKIVITGKRDKEILDLIEKHGGTLQSAINKSTDILIAEDKNGKSSKIKKANDLGIIIYDFEGFKSLF